VTNDNLVNDVSVVEAANRLRPTLLRLYRELRREVHAVGVTGYQISLLVAIKQSPGLGVRGLAAQERISPAAMSGHVARLEGAGLVERRVDAKDRRRHGLTLTAAGEGVLRSVKRRRTAWLVERLGALSGEELQAVEAALGPLERLLEDAQ
jgi:DNA-binding MarR family transcriptional regulator